MINREDTEKEWLAVKKVVLAQGYPRDNTQKLWSMINLHHSEDFPNLLKLAEIAVTAPTHTAGCDRGFSVQNYILNPLRNRLNVTIQEKLLRIKIEAESLGQFPFERSIKLYQKKARRVLSYK